MTILFDVEDFKRKIYKVTGSQDDGFWGVDKNIPNKLALTGLRPSFSAQVR